MNCTNARGHELIPVLFIDQAKGQPHYFGNGSQMKQDGPTYRANDTWESTFWNDDGQFIAIYNDHLNMLPGTHEYNARILIYDKTLGHFIGDIPNIPWITFTMTGAQEANSGSSSYNYHYITPTPVPAPSNNSGGSNYHNPAEKRQCPICVGTGQCRSCGGTGNRVVSTYKANHIHTCGVCHGTGKCQQCYGSGKVYWCIKNIVHSKECQHPIRQFSVRS